MNMIKLEWQRNMQRLKSNAEFAVFQELKDPSRDCSNDVFLDYLIFLDNGDVQYRNMVTKYRVEKAHANETSDCPYAFTLPDLYLRHRKIAVYIDGHDIHTKKNTNIRDDIITERLTHLDFNVYRLPYKGVLSQRELLKFCDLVEQRWKY